MGYIHKTSVRQKKIAHDKWIATWSLGRTLKQKAVRSSHCTVCSILPGDETGKWGLGQQH